MVKSGEWRKLTAALLILIAFCFFSGCSSAKGKTGDTSSVSEVKNESMPVYYDFGDILIPRELKIDKSASFVFRTPGISAGVLSLKGRVEVNSLIQFFETNMANDNWTAVSSFKSPRTIMLFKKENRWCVVNITEKDVYTYVEIWVAPTIQGAESTLLN